MSAVSIPPEIEALNQLRAEGFEVAAKLRINPKPGATPSPGMIDRAAKHRDAILRHLANSEPDTPSYPDIRGITNVLHDAEASPWIDGVPHPDAGPRLLSAIGPVWPADAVKVLSDKWANDVLVMTADDAFSALFRACIDVTRGGRGHE